ncbi:MAG TPA: outer membrane beta-barrel protein [Puia sp.]|nr:outer membrane beta-barrel protein [Puia sp.]
MPKPIILLSCFLLLRVSVLAQSSQISGTVTDTIEKKALANASVLLLRPSDSVLIRHTRTGAAGRFAFHNLPSGHYLLLVTYPSYADYVDEVEVKDSASVDLPGIPLVLKSTLLAEVVVKGTASVRIKGDTTEFNSDSFRTEAGATVEDLLRKLPGIQVDRNVKITAQGESVKKILVDGEEFFGDDPTLVTQNLRADMIDKVQVYDKKSDQATFTGIDDGQREKTINLKLKDGKKNGYFGRATAGAGTDGYYDEELMANYFRNKRKIAGYGIVSNTGKTGLNWSDRDNYGQSVFGTANVDASTGAISIQGNGDDLDTWSGQYQGQGSPSVRTGGLHYNDKWNDDNQSINGNYKYMNLGVTGTNTTNSQYILPDTVYYNNQRQVFNNNIVRQTLDGNYEAKFDSTTSLDLMANGGTDHKTTFNGFHSVYLASDSSLVNSNDRTTTTTGDKRIVNSNLLFRKRMSKVGRTFSLNVRENYTDDASSGYLNSETRLYNHGNAYSDSLIDQFKDYRTTSLLVDSRATYTEPLSKTSFLVASYGLLLNNSHSNRDSYNRASGGKYTALDSLYSNDYQYNVLAQRAGMAYRFSGKKLRVSAGADVGRSRLEQRDLRADTMATRRFVDWYPTASLSYAFTSMRKISLQYNGSTSQPSVTQIQPIFTNEDPLNIYIGNPALKPQFNHRLSLFFNDYKVLTDRGLWANLWSNYTANDISTSVSVDSVGRSVHQYVNVKATWSFNGFLSYSFKWKKPDIRFNMHVNGNESSNSSIVNGLTNDTRSGTWSLGTGIDKSKEKKYDVGVDLNASYTTSNSSINTGVVTKYWTYEIQPNIDIFLPLKLQLHADADINLRQKTVLFPNNNNVVLLNAYLGKKLLKRDALLIKLAVNDVLNQNVGFNRTVNSNFISQNTYTTIRRFAMLAVVWNFTKPGTTAPSQRF